MSSVSDIKLIRTDTTLDLSQKAEKRYRQYAAHSNYTKLQNISLCFTTEIFPQEVIFWRR